MTLRSEVTARKGILVLFSVLAIALLTVGCPSRSKEPPNVTVAQMPSMPKEAETTSAPPDPSTGAGGGAGATAPGEETEFKPVSKVLPPPIRGVAEGSGGGAGSMAVKPVDLKMLTQALKSFVKTNKRPPTDLDELVAAGLVPYVPNVPTGKKFFIDEQKAEVRIVNI